MIFNKNASVLSDNGEKVFLVPEIEEILTMAYDYDYSNNSRKNRYCDEEVCDCFDISVNELNQMKYLLSYEYNTDENGGLKQF